MRFVHVKISPVLIDSGLDLNAVNGTILSAVAREPDHNAFDILFEAGCDPALLDDAAKSLHGFSRPEMMVIKISSICLI